MGVNFIGAPPSLSATASRGGRGRGAVSGKISAGDARHLRRCSSRDSTNTMGTAQNSMNSLRPEASLRHSSVETGSMQCLVIGAPIRTREPIGTRRMMPCGFHGDAGHFHLVQQVLPQLQAQQEDVRVVAVACKDQMDTSLRITDINFSKVLDCRC